MPETAQRDYLTGFFLRDSLDNFLQDILLTDRSGNKIFSVAVIDVDRFKRFNDKFGHDFGDEILKYVASTLRLTLFDPQYRFFRYGGDEFVIILPDKDSKESFSLLRSCNLNIYHRAFLYQRKLYKVTISCGIASFPRDADSAVDLIKKADKAMYFSKRHGFNHTTLAGSMSYIRLRNAVAMFCGITAALVFLFVLFRQEYVQHVIRQVLQLKFATKQDLETGIVVLKNGSICEGRILSEDRDKVVISSKLGRGTGTLTIPKSKISEIKYKFRNAPK